MDEGFARYMGFEYRVRRGSPSRLVVVDHSLRFRHNSQGSGGEGELGELMRLDKTNDMELVFVKDGPGGEEVPLHHDWVHGLWKLGEFKREVRCVVLPAAFCVPPLLVSWS
jgi:hypothetical protein